MSYDPPIRAFALGNSDFTYKKVILLLTLFMIDIPDFVRFVHKLFEKLRYNEAGRRNYPAARSAPLCF